MKFSMIIILIAAAIALCAQEIQAPSMTNDYKASLIDTLASAFDRVYIFPDKGHVIAGALRSNLESGTYAEFDDPVEFAGRLEQDVREACPDKHLSVFYAPERIRLMKMQKSQSPEAQREAYEQELKTEQRENFGFKEVKVMSGNVGYLRFDGFSGLPEAYPVAVSAMNFVTNCDALIIDLRHNGGGSAYMIQLLSSFLFDEHADPVHLNTFLHRASDTADQTWTLPYVPGKRLDKDAPVYLLTSDYTFSAAEEFTYNLKNLERATIVGENTGGGAHPVSFLAVDDWFIAKIPSGRALNPITNTNWEGTGIAPDIETTSDEAMDVAYEKALEKLRDQTDDPEAQFVYEWVLDGLQYKDLKMELSKRQMKAYTGTYGPRKISYRDGNLYYQRTGPEFKMIPYKDDHFFLEGLDYFRIRFERNEDGDITAMIGLYDNGRTDPSARTE